MEAGELLSLTQDAIAVLDRLAHKATANVRAAVEEEGRISSAAVEREQHAAHGLAWFGTTVEALRQMGAYAERMSAEGRFGDAEALLVRAAFGEYLNQVFGGIPMSQGEFVRPGDLGLGADDLADARNAAVEELMTHGNTRSVRAGLIEMMAAAEGAATLGDAGLDDTLEAFREEMRRFAEAEVVPYAHDWHLKNDYIPLDVISKMAELGVFGLTIPEEFGGLGLGKESMCVVSEELSRAYI
ncbi:MAG: acyl-CoA dehydrogenase family protein, partial [Hyphomicrobiales bacterium]|nr:acyl-CoA dehydrogenase family protein [Hyphomicrobiales bacterium]